MTKALVRARGWWEDLQDALWIFPSIGIIVAMVLARLLVALDPVPHWVPEGWAFVGGPSAARSVLTELAGVTFTVVGLVFSLTVIALQMASAQFTPRLLRTFLKDRSVQVVLSGLISSGVFHVSVLRHVRSPDEGDLFVPELAVTAALLFGLAAVSLLVYFLHRLTSQLRVDVVMASIRRETLRQLAKLPADRDELPDQPAPDPPAGAVAVTSLWSGYLQTIDLAVLVAVAVQQGVVIRLRPSAGMWVADGTTLAWVWAIEGGPPRTGADPLARAIHGGLHLGPDRTESGDLAFGLRQLEDIAARALSTGVNDSTTAVQAIAQLGGILVQMAHHPLGVDIGRDEHDLLRVAAPRPTFASHLELAVGQVRRSGADKPEVLIAILQLLTDVAERVADSADRAEAVRDQIERTQLAADLSDPVDIVRVERAAAMARGTLDSGDRPAMQAEAG